MSSLSVYHVSSPEIPNKVLTHFEDIASTLAEKGVRFDRWEAAARIQPGASQEEVIAAYRTQIDKLMTERGYVTVDVISLNSDHPQKPNCAPSSSTNTAMERTRCDFSSPVVACLPCTSTIMSTRCCAKERPDLGARRYAALVRHGRTPAFRCHSPVQQSRRLGREVYRRRHRQPFPTPGGLSS